MLKICIRLLLAGVAGIACCVCIEPETALGLLSDWTMPKASDSVAAKEQLRSAEMAMAQAAEIIRRAQSSQPLSRQGMSGSQGMAGSQVTAGSKGTASRKGTAGSQSIAAAQMTSSMDTVRSSQPASTAPDTVKQQLQDAFFSDAPAAPEPGVLSNLKLPFMSSDAEPKYQPIDLGAEVQTNPFIK